jgi:predicted RNA-binding Zn ribbon-like protein
VIEAPPDLRLVEEFLNTVDERTFSRHGEVHRASERLTSSKVLGDWLTDHGLTEPGTRLLPADLSAALALRAALRAVLRADGADSGAAFADFEIRLAPDPNGGLRITAVSGRSGLNAIVETVAVAVADGRWARMKLCAAPDCRWAFYDTSRSGGGRWCSMSACGNRHKTRAYRERRQPT